MRLQTSLTPEEKTGGYLRELWIEIGPRCHLACNFCFNSAGGQCPATTNQMTEAKYADVIKQFARCGGKLIGIPGFGEPFISPNLDLTMSIVNLATSLGMRCHVFTAGDVLTKELILELKTKPISLGIKFNHFNPLVQDALVNDRGYTKRREQALKLLLQNDFYSQGDSETTRVSFVTSILPENFEVLPEIYRHCRQNGIVPDIDMLLPAGRASKQHEFYQLMAKEAFSVLRQIDQEEFGIVWESDSPTFVGSCCDRCYYHLYVDFQDRVSPCLGANKKGVFLGSLRNQTLESFWNSNLMSVVRSRNYTGRCTQCLNFQEGKCNSCLGRFAAIDGNRVQTIECWNFK